MYSSLTPTGLESPAFSATLLKQSPNKVENGGMQKSQKSMVEFLPMPT